MERYRRFARDRWMECQYYLTVILIDTSESMATADWPPSRLHGAMAAVDGLLDTKHQYYPDDWVGLAGFSDTSRMFQPLVRIGDNRHSMGTNPEHIRLGPSTNMTDGLLLAGKMIHDECYRLACTPHHRTIGKQIILLTDGEHNAGSNPVPVAHGLQQNGIFIDVIGIGTPWTVADTCARALASVRNGQPSYCFIGDAAGLIVEMKKLAHHICPINP